LAATKQEPFSQDSFKPVVENSLNQLSFKPVNQLTFESVTSLEEKEDDDGRSLEWTTNDYEMLEIIEMILDQLEQLIETKKTVYRATGWLQELERNTTVQEKERRPLLAD
jgi:hypothetical protein